MLLLLLLLLSAATGCTKDSDTAPAEIRPGTYYLSGTVYFEAAMLYTKQQNISDTGIIRAFVNDFADYWEKYGSVGDFPAEPLRTDIELQEGPKALENPDADSRLEILPGQTARLINFRLLKDSVICDIRKNGDGSFSLTDRDSTGYSTHGCNSLQVDMLDKSTYRKITIWDANGQYSFYRGRSRLTLAVNNGQLELYARTVFNVRGTTCKEYTVNSLLHYFPPDVNTFAVNDTALIQEKRYVFKAR